MALDACAGGAQVYTVRRLPPADGQPSRVAIDLFSPIPRWAQSRLEAVGTLESLSARGPRALMTISVPTEETDEEVQFLRRSLWLKPVG